MLGEEGEKIVVEWLLNRNKCGFPVQKQEVLDYVQRILKDLKITNPFKEDCPCQS